MSATTSRFVRLTAGFALILAGGTLHAGDSPGIVVFGDSLSDPGNHYIAFGETARQPYEPVPSASYAIGGHHFSNGRTWIEQITEETGLSRDAGPALRPSGGGHNYAVGRARARANAAEFPHYDLSTQVGLFLSRHGGEAPANAVYVLWIGSNDVRDALAAIAAGGGSLQSQVEAQQILGAALQAIAGNVIALYSGGARYFAIINVPNPALTPVVRALPPVVQGLAAQLALGFNAGLDHALAGLSPLLPGAEFLAVDAYAVLERIVADPQASGLDEVEQPCLSFGVVGRSICSEPGQHLFWDGTHPTAAAHGAFAAAVLELLSES